MASRRNAVAVVTTKDAQGNVTSKRTSATSPELQAVYGGETDFDDRGPTLLETLTDNAMDKGPLGLPMGAWAAGLAGLAWWSLS